MDGFEPKPISLKRLHGVLASVAQRPETVNKQASLPHPTALPQPENGIAPARKAELIEVLGNEIFEELVASFFADAEVLVKAYLTARAAGSVHEADTALHTLKGAAANVGFHAVADLAQTLRQAPQTEDTSHRLTALLASYTINKAA